MRRYNEKFYRCDKRKNGQSIGEKILISYNSEDFHKFSELKNTFKSNHWSSLDVYILLKKKIEGRRLDSILHNIKDYSFVALKIMGEK